MAWSQQHSPYEYGKNEKIYNFTTSKKIEGNNGELLFSYEGLDANCWKKEKEWEVKKCLEEHPYGGQGSLVVGGNLVINNAQAIYLNGSDSTGFHWIMSSTLEPYGNAIGIRKRTGSSLLFGNNLVTEGDIDTDVVTFDAAKLSVVLDIKSELMVDQGAFAEVGKVIFSNMKDDSNDSVLEILDTGICGVCGDECSEGKVGKDYQFILKKGLNVKELTKVNGQIRLCGQVDTCEEACCRELKYLEDDTWDNFVGSECSLTPCNFLPPDPYGLGSTYCYPQPYPHYDKQDDPLIADYYSTEAGYKFRKGNARIAPSGNTYDNANFENQDVKTWVDPDTGESYALKGNGDVVNTNTGEVFTPNEDHSWSSQLTGEKIKTNVVETFGLQSFFTDEEDFWNWTVKTVSFQFVGAIVSTPLSLMVTLVSAVDFFENHPLSDLFDSIKGFFGIEESTEEEVNPEDTISTEDVASPEDDVSGVVDDSAPDTEGANTEQDDVDEL